MERAAKRFQRQVNKRYRLARVRPAVGRNGVGDIPNHGEQENDNPEALKQTEDGGMEASQAEMEAGAAEAGDKPGAIKAEVPRGNKLPRNMRAIPNALTEKTGRRPEYRGLSREKNHWNLQYASRCPVHSDNNPSFQVGLI